MTPRFDLVDIVKALYQKRRLLILISLLAAGLGAVGYFLRKDKYRAKSEVIVANPIFADRNYFFRTNTDRYIDYFAGEDDIDRVMAIGNSDRVRDKVIEALNLYQHYGLNSDKQADQMKMMGIWKQNFKLVRTEYKNVEVMFTDGDPKMAAEVVNKMVSAIEEEYRGFYLEIKNQLFNSLNIKLQQADSAIALLTDSLIRLRDEYGIYDLISPARTNVLVGSIKSGGQKQFGRGVEEIQNLSAIKDRWVIDRSNYLSLMNEFSTGTQPDALSFVKIITPAVPPLKPTGLSLILTVIGSALLAFFVTALLILLNTYLKEILKVQR